MHGIGRVLLELLNCWRRQGLRREVCLLTNTPAALAEHDLLPAYDVVELRSRPFSLGELAELTLSLWRLRPRLFHAPTICLPPWLVAPTVVTVHDLVPLQRSGWRPRLYERLVLARGLRGARRIMTDSSYVAEQVAGRFGIGHERLVVAPLAPFEARVAPQPWPVVQAALGLRQPYVFCMGNPKPHKNLQGAIRIFERLRDRSARLVIASARSPDLDAAVRASTRSADIQQIEYVPEAMLSAVFEHAAMFICPSYDEGFGLPPLEAMRHRCPVVSSDRGSLREVVGKGGVLVDPDDTAAFAAAIDTLLSDERERQALRRRGHHWQQRYSWERTAQQVWHVYEDVLARPNR